MGANNKLIFPEKLDVIKSAKETYEVKVAITTHRTGYPYRTGSKMRSDEACQGEKYKSSQMIGPGQLSTSQYRFSIPDPADEEELKSFWLCKKSTPGFWRALGQMIPLFGQSQPARPLVHYCVPKGGISVMFHTTSGIFYRVTEPTGRTADYCNVYKQLLLQTKNSVPGPYYCWDEPAEDYSDGNPVPKQIKKKMLRYYPDMNERQHDIPRCRAVE